MNWHDYFEYRDGLLIWKVRAASKIKPGDVVGSIDKVTGYVIAGVRRKRYKAHRIIWELFNGPIPEGMEIDHADHNRANNRIDNLRLVTRADNNRNASKNKRNTSGFTGVLWCKASQKWQARIQINCKPKHLGLFTNKNSAILARMIANKEYNFHEHHGGTKATEREMMERIFTARHDSTE